MLGAVFSFALVKYQSACVLELAVHRVEYAFGAHKYPTTGIFEGEPKQCEGFTFRKTILIGRTDMGPAQVRSVMEELAEEYRGNAYNLITKNCNHFCNDACVRLTGNPIPSWVNRLARIGSQLPLLPIFFPLRMSIFFYLPDLCIKGGTHYFLLLLIFK